MWEENQKSILDWNMYLPDTVKTRLKEIWEQRRQLKQQSEDASLNKLADTSQHMTAQSYNVSDMDAKKKYDKMSQAASVAYMIKYAAKRNWQDRPEQTIMDIMSRYYSIPEFQQNAGKIWEFINSDRDPEEFGIEMWWIPTDTEDNMNILEKIFLTDWRDLKWAWWDVLRNVKSAWDLLAQWAIDLGWAKMKNGANTDYYNNMADTMALDDYAYRKYGKTIANMSEEEIDRLELDLALNNAKNWQYIVGNWEAWVSNESPYQDSEDRQRYDIWTIETAAWGFLEGLTMVYPRMTLWFSLGSVLPWSKQLLELVAAAWYEVAWLTEMIPWVSDWIKSLPEDLQWEIKTIWGNVILWAIAWEFMKAWRPKIKWNVKVQEAIWKIKWSAVIQTIKDTYNNIGDAISHPFDKTLNWIWDKWWKTKDVLKGDKYKSEIEWLEWLEREEAIENAKKDYAWKIAWSTSPELALNEIEIANRALQELKDSWVDVSKITTDEQLIDALWDQADKIAVFEDWIYKQDKRRWKRVDTRKTVTNTDEFWMQDRYISDTIWKWFEVLKDIYKWDAQMESQIRLLEKRWIEKWLTRQEVNNMARTISEWAKIYKNTTRDTLSAKYVENIERTRKALKERAREPYKEAVPWLYKVLEYLDGVWSDNLNLQAMETRNLSRTAAYKAGYPWQEAWQEIGSFGKKTLYSKGKNILNMILKDVRYNPVTRSADLSTNLSKYRELDSGVPRNNYWKAVEDWYWETFRNIEDPNWTFYKVWEWEVINPKKRNYKDPKNYLEDIVEIVESEEVSAADLMKFENQLRKLWLSEEEIADVKRATSIVQESLFDVEWQPKQVWTINEEWVASWTPKKNSKKSNPK